MNELMYPRGGGFIKNTLAGLMLYKSSVGQAESIDLNLVNSRVPPSRGLVVGDSDIHYNDSFVFQGSDSKGSLFMTRLGFRGDGTICDSWLWMILDGKKYTWPTTLVPGVAADRVEAQGISYSFLGDGQWKISYEGPLDQGILSCRVDLVYTPSTQMYSFGVHADRKTFALALAEMEWNREYFKTLNRESAERIEQGGTLSGTISLDGKVFNLSLKSFRDHSWGKRDWTKIHRYIWNLFALESPLKIAGGSFTHACFTTVHYVSFKHLVSGWVAGPDMILPIVASSDMHQLGADGTVPSEFTVSFRPKGGPDLKAVVSREKSTEHPWMIQDDLFEVNEGYCTLEIDGISGCGMSEFGYSKER